MDKNTIIKWVLIAGAAYLVYRWAVTQGYIGGAPVGNESLPLDRTVDVTTTNVVAATTPTAATIAASILAAPGFYYDPAGSNTQNAYQWNYWWMRSSLTNHRDAAPMELGIDPGTQLTVDEYAQRVFNLYFLPAGLSGLLERLPTPAFAAAWRM